MEIKKSCENCKHRRDSGIICDSCTWANFNWEPKESEGKEMKMYSLLNVMLKLKTHEAIKFVRISDGLGLSADEEGNLNWESGHKKLNLNDKFEKVQEPVSFVEAANSGKKIKPSIGGYEYNSIYDWLKVLQNSSVYSMQLLLNGKWYIE